MKHFGYYISTKTKNEEPVHCNVNFEILLFEEATLFTYLWIVKLFSKFLF